MEPPRVYIETTIPSAYFDTRTAPEMIRRREATRRWWELAAERYELVTSAMVHEELRNGPRHRIERWVKLLDSIPLLEREAEIEEIVLAYIREKVMPSDPIADSTHLAFASYHRCDYLLTWNFKHLANPRKFRHIQVVNGLLDLFVPRIVSPWVLLEEKP
jgi:predicted nucleic acid-binding protein